MKPLDKKQIPQVVALAVLAVVFLGYFVVKMILPAPAAAGTQVAAPAAKPLAKAAPAGAAAVPEALTVPAPAAGMHDPFVQALSDQPAPTAPPTAAPAIHTASLKVAAVAPLAIPTVPSLPLVGIHESNPAVAGLPSVGGLTPVVPHLPAAPVAPDWTVTGVLQSGADHVAVLRSGEVRRFVKQGDDVDGQFVVAAVTRDCVVLRHGGHRYMLPLGGVKTAPTPPAKAPVPAGAAPSAPQPVAPKDNIPDILSDLAGGKPAAYVAPRPKGVRSSPRIAHLPAHPSLAAFPGMGYAPPTRLPFAGRRKPSCPTVRVAAYRSEKVSPLFPAGGARGLLPSGLPAPDFSLSTLGGEAFSLSQFRGSVVVLDFWASWYAPSARSLETLALLQKRLGAQGLTVLAVNSWDNRSGMLAALRGGEGSTMQLFDPTVSNESVAVRLYHAPDVPTFYVIDRDGRVAAAFVGSGQSTFRNIEATLARLGLP